MSTDRCQFQCLTRIYLADICLLGSDACLFGKQTPLMWPLCLLGPLTVMLMTLWGSGQAKDSEPMPRMTDFNLTEFCMSLVSHFVCEILVSNPPKSWRRLETPLILPLPLAECHGNVKISQISQLCPQEECFFLALYVYLFVGGIGIGIGIGHRASACHLVGCRRAATCQLF